LPVTLTDFHCRQRGELVRAYLLDHEPRRCSTALLDAIKREVTDLCLAQQIYKAACASAAGLKLLK
jgi:hypothetical protein